MTKTIFVNATAATERGALTILKIGIGKKSNVNTLNEKTQDLDQAKLEL